MLNPTPQPHHPEPRLPTADPLSVEELATLCRAAGARRNFAEANQLAEQILKSIGISSQDFGAALSLQRLDALVPSGARAAVALGFHVLAGKVNHRPDGEHRLWAEHLLERSCHLDPRSTQVLWDLARTRRFCAQYGVWAQIPEPAAHDAEMRRQAEYVSHAAERHLEIVHKLDWKTVNKVSGRIRGEEKTALAFALEGACQAARITGVIFRAHGIDPEKQRALFLRAVVWGQTALRLHDFSADYSPAAGLAAAINANLPPAGRERLGRVLLSVSHALEAIGDGIRAAQARSVSAALQLREPPSIDTLIPARHPPPLELFGSRISIQPKAQGPATLQGVPPNIGAGAASPPMPRNVTPTRSSAQSSLRLSSPGPSTTPKNRQSTTVASSPPGQRAEELQETPHEPPPVAPLPTPVKLDSFEGIDWESLVQLNAEKIPNTPSPLTDKRITDAVYEARGLSFGAELFTQARSTFVDVQCLKLADAPHRQLYHAQASCQVERAETSQEAFIKLVRYQVTLGWLAAWRGASEGERAKARQLASQCERAANGLGKTLKLQGAHSRLVTVFRRATEGLPASVSGQ